MWGFGGRVIKVTWELAYEVKKDNRSVDGLLSGLVLYTIHVLLGDTGRPWSKGSEGKIGKCC